MPSITLPLGRPWLMKEQSGGSAGPFNALVAQEWDNGKQVGGGCLFVPWDAGCGCWVGGERLKEG